MSFPDMRTPIKLLYLALVATILVGCAAKGPEMKTVDHVDIDRFMGPWYVIAEGIHTGCRDECAMGNALCLAHQG
jgi:lipocalin